MVNMGDQPTVCLCCWVFFRYNSKHVFNQYSNEGNSNMRPITILMFMVAVVVGISAQDTEDAVRLLGHGLPVNDVAYSPDGALLASASSDITTRLWDTTTGDALETLEGQLIAVRSVAISPDGDTVLTTGFNGAAYLWDLATQTRGESIVAEVPFNDGDFAPDGTSAALAMGDGAVRIYDLAEQDVIATLTLPDDMTVLLIEALAYSPDGTQIAAGTGFPADALVVWDVAEAAVQFAIQADAGTVHSVAFAPQGGQVASGHGDGTVRLWSASAGEAQMVIEAHAGEVFDVAYHPAGEQLASVGFDGVLRVWNLSDGTLAAEIAPADAPRSLMTVSYSPAGDQIAYAGESGVIYLQEVAAE